MSSTLEMISQLRFVRAFALASVVGAAVSGCATEGDAPASDESEVQDQGGPVLRDTLSEILAGIPDDAEWDSLSPETKTKLAGYATAFFERNRHEWGTRGLTTKVNELSTQPTPAMTENYDKLLGFLMKADVPEGFTFSKDVKNAKFGAELKRFYVAFLAVRRHFGAAGSIPGVKDWDGSDLKGFMMPNDGLVAEQSRFVVDIENALKRIPASQLSDAEKSIATKLGFLLRQLKHGSSGYNIGGHDFQRTSAAPGFMYDLVAEYKPSDHASVFQNDEQFLQTTNALTMQRLIQTNMGTADTFVWNHGRYVDPEWMKATGLDATTPAGKGYLKLVKWWKTRVTSSPDATKRCTVWSKNERSAAWDALTADNLANADGSYTLEKFASDYTPIAAKRLDFIKRMGHGALTASFPVGSPLLTPAQRAKVDAAIDAETRPAAVADTIVGALDAATGNTNASAEFTKQRQSLSMIGGYAEGEALRPADEQTVLTMWEQIRSFLAARYAGKPVNVAAALPAKPTVTTGGSTFAGTSGVTVGLKTATNRATLYSTLLHEGKHAIDFTTKASVQGSAWEGAAVLTEHMIGESLLAQVMADEAQRLPLYRLQYAIDDVRLTATTDATIKVILRPSCPASEPNTIDFAKNIVASYGYTDPDLLQLRARRAHNSVQYLSYDLGMAIYADLMTWLETQAGAPKGSVDPILLQACGMPSPNKDAAAVSKLKTCLGL